jgi:hypothetical protein
LTLTIVCFPLLFLPQGACEDNGPVTQHHDLSANADMAMLPFATTLTTTDTLTNCIAVDATDVYWTESSATMIPDAGSLSRLVKVSKNGGTPTVLLDAIESPGCAVIDDTNAYVVQGGDLLKVPLAGGSPMTIAQSQHVLPGSTPKLAVAGGYLYWITDVYGSVDAYNGMNALVRVSTSGGSPTPLFTDLTGSPGGIAADATNVYYSDMTGMYVRPIAGGAAVPIGQSSLHNNRFAVDSMHIALVELTGLSPTDAGMVGKGDVAVSKLDGSGRTLVSMNLATSLAIDETGVYAEASGALTRFALDGSGTEVLSLSMARAIALDATDIYFTDGASILRFAK